MARSRHEAVWTAEEASVKGKVKRNQAWVMLVMVGVGAALICGIWWTVTMNFQSVTFELRSCQAPLTADATWAEVQDAACDPAPAAGSTMMLWAGGDTQDPSTTSTSSWTFDKVPLNTSLTAMEVRLAKPAQTVVLAEPDNESLRRGLTGDASGQKWTANVGARGPTTYWVLVTPAP